MKAQGNRIKTEIHSDENNKQKFNHRGKEATQRTQRKSPFSKRYRPIYYPTTRFSDRLKTNYLPFEDAKSHFKLKLCVFVVKII